MIPEQFKQYLDSLDDELFLAWLSMNYGTKIPKWEECSKDEYVQHCGTYGIDHDNFTQQDLEKIIGALCSSGNYKREAIYKDAKDGILYQIKQQNRKPDGYRYYRQVGEDFVIILGSDLFEYCQTREIMKPYFQLIY